MVIESIWNSNQTSTTAGVQIHDGYRDSFLNVAAISADVVLHFLFCDVNGSNN